MANDGDMHFPPAQRRDKPAFEPPPWELDQFEELARRRNEQAAGITTPEAPVAEAEAPAEPEVTGPAAQAPGAAPKAGVPATGVGGELDEKHVEMLLEQLRAEEPRPEKMYWKIVAGSGVVSALVGLMVTTWAVVVIAAPKKAGGGELMFEAMLLLLGVGFIAGGAWVVFKSLRQQGVL